MLNYSVDAELLRPLVPVGTELDLFEGRAYVSLVGFRFLNTKLLGVPIPFHRDFEEVNLRFYVRREGKRGVVFIKEIVPKHAIALIARLAYNENYLALPMWHDVSSDKVSYGWEPSCSMDVTVSGTARLSEPGSAENFITEHYWGYTAQRDGGTLEYEVRHEPWLVRRAVSSSFQGHAEGLYGESFARILSKPADTAFLAEGSPIEVMRGTRLE